MKASKSNMNYTGDDYRVFFKMTEDGRSSAEIAKILNRDIKAIYNLKSKIRRQLGVRPSKQMELKPALENVMNEQEWMPFWKRLFK